MTKDEIIRMAREAGFGQPYVGAMKYELKRFAALVAAEKDKEIAELYAMCLKQAKTIKEHQDAAIRARSDNDN